MATFTVTTAADVVSASDGVLSLREAVNLANATTTADVIGFDSTIKGDTLVLTSGELVLSSDVTIQGSGVTIDGDDSSRLLEITGADTDVTLTNLTLANGQISGYLANGAGVLVGYGASLSMTNCTVRNCHNFAEYGNGSYSGDGAGIFAAGGSQVAITDCSITDNTSGEYGFGGGIATGANVTLTVRDSRIADNWGSYGGGGIRLRSGSTLMMEDSVVSGNDALLDSGGGGLLISGARATIARSTISGNRSDYSGGGLLGVNSYITVIDSTIANNSTGGYQEHGGGGLFVDDSILIVRNTTITGNYAFYEGGGGGIDIARSQLDIANSIVAGNNVRSGLSGPDISGTIAVSNGHNIFGSDVAGNNPGDRENVAASSIFAAIDPETGGGLLAASGIVPLRNAITNPALSGADLLAASAFGQLGGTARPLPAGSLPDLGSIEINQPLSTTASANNDVLTGTAAANTINGLAGADFIKGLGGNDTLRGGDGGDLLDGGAGNDKLYGDAGIDLVFYGGATKVKVDLSLATDKATRGSETDTLYNVEGAIGSSAADTFKGNQYNNFFQGGLGKDTATGGSGRDLYDFNAVADSQAGATTRDLITDFDHLVDKLDLMGLDADTGVAGNQAFRWVGTAALSGPGEVGFFTSGGTTIIRASNDADAASEFEIQLTGIKALTAVDFYL